MGARPLSLTLLGLTLIVASACLLPPPHQEGRQPAAQRQQPEAVPPPHLRELVSGKTVSLQIPQELRAFAIDYLRAAEAIVVEGTAELQLETTYRSDSIYAGGARGGSVGQRTIVEAELKALRSDGARRILLRGRGEVSHDGRYPSGALETAGKRALINLH